MCGGTSWGNGQSGDEYYSGPENNYANPNTPHSAPNSYGQTTFVDSTGSSSNPITSNLTGSSGANTSPSAGTALNPITAGGGAISSSQNGGFDNSGFNSGINFGNVMSFDPSATFNSGGNGGGGFGDSGAPSQSIADMAAGGGSPVAGFESVGGSGNLSSYSPGGGINVPSDFPDPTSDASQAGGTGGVSQATDFSSRAQPATDAVSSGQFDPQGSNYTSYSQPMSSGFTPQNVGSVPITDMAAAAQPSTENAPSVGASGFSAGGALQEQPQQLSTFSGAAPAAAASAPSVAAGGDKSALQKLADGAMASVARNPLGILAAAGGLGLNMAQGNKTPEGLDEIRAAAASLKSTGSVLSNYLQTGTLPPGMQTSVDAATKAAKARIIQNYAQRGMPTDPTKNSALQAELSGVDQNAIITAATLGDKLMSQGLNATQISQQLYQAILKVDQDRSRATGSAISNFAAALGGGGNQIKISA